jgi:hypothetical protein
MGAGLAKQCKERYPSVETLYLHLHKHDQLRINRPDLVNTFEGKLILLFPTKRDWRKPSRLDWIETNLIWIKNEYPDRNLRGIQSLALPALGCGHGGLDWLMVKELIYIHLAELELPIELYPPAEPYVPKPRINPATIGDDIKW